MDCNKQRFPMPLSRRAKQFMAFDALKGFKEAIAATECYTEPKKELSDSQIEYINQNLVSLRKGETVIITYYGAYEERYIQLTGIVEKIDLYWRTLMVGKVVIDFSEICEIEILKSA